MKNGQSSCETCIYNVYDDDYECYTCQMSMDEDELVRITSDPYSHCSYYRSGDDYAIVRKQM